MPSAKNEKKKLIILWGAFILTFTIFCIYSKNVDIAFPSLQHFQNLIDYATILPEAHVLKHGFREIWVIHPPNRDDLNSQMDSDFRYALLPYWIAASFDNGTYANQTSLAIVARQFADECKWMLDQHFDYPFKSKEEADVYGGWQSHLYVWGRIVDYCVNSRTDIPVVVLEDDAKVDPNFLTRLSFFMNRLPNDWTVLSLDCPDTKRTKLGRALNKIKHPYFGHGYVIRNSKTASTLFSDNNVEEPPFMIRDSSNKLTWHPNINKKWKGYCVSDHKLMQSNLRRSSHPHDGFTPIYVN